MADEAPKVLTPGDEIEVSYIKSGHFRVVYAEGAYGGISPHGQISFCLYNERGPVPRKTKLVVNRTGDGTEEEVLEAREGFVREVEVQIVMSPADTETLVTWLSGKLDLARRMAG